MGEGEKNNHDLCRALRYTVFAVTAQKEGGLAKEINNISKKKSVSDLPTLPSQSYVTPNIDLFFWPYIK